MRLYITLVNGLRFKLPLHNHVGFRESFLYIPQLMLYVSSYVSFHASIFTSGAPVHTEHCGQCVMEYGSVIFAGVVLRQYRGQDFVIYLDEF